MPISHAAHKVYEIRYHIVITVKYRKRLILPEERISFLKYVLLEIEKRYDIRFDTVGTDGNHAHFFIDTPPKYSPSEIFKIVKSITARELFIKFPEIKKNCGRRKNCRYCKKIHIATGFERRKRRLQTVQIIQSALSYVPKMPHPLGWGDSLF